MAKILMILSIISIFSACGTKNENIDKNVYNIQDSVKKSDDGKISEPYHLSPNQAIIKLNDEEFKMLIGGEYKSRNPDENDIGLAVKIIQQCFENQKRGTVNYLLDKTPGDYKQQYVGILASNGDKMLWVNFFNKSLKDYENWQSQVVTSYGGGNNFFNIKVNLTQNTYTDLKINENK